MLLSSLIRTVSMLNTNASQQEPHLCSAERVSMSTPLLARFATNALACEHLVKNIGMYKLPWIYMYALLSLFSFDDVIHITLASDITGTQL